MGQYDAVSDMGDSDATSQKLSKSKFKQMGSKTSLVNQLPHLPVYQKSGKGPNSQAPNSKKDTTQPS